MVFTVFVLTRRKQNLSFPMISLKEKHIYPFTIEGELELPDGNECYKLTDPNGIKHILLKSDYRKYGFKSGDIIQCYIDKINCSGRLFFEPEHPFYMTGHCYDFEFTRIEKETDQKAVGQIYAVLQDALQNETTVPLEDIPAGAKRGDRITFRIDLIKKGKVYLRPCGSEEHISNLATGAKIELVMVGLKTYNRSRTYFVLKDQKERLYYIRKKFYSKYGFKEGEVVNCEVKEFQGLKYLEPVHPVFRKDTDFNFEIIGSEIVKKYPGTDVKVYNLKNPYGKTIVLEADQISEGAIRNNHINCRVMDIIHSTPILQCK